MITRLRPTPRLEVSGEKWAKVECYAKKWLRKPGVQAWLCLAAFVLAFVLVAWWLSTMALSPPVPMLLGRGS